MSSLLIVRGLPGSGKSTFSKKLLEKFPNAVHFENDEYLLQNGKYVWTPDASKKAAQQCFNDTMSALNQVKT